MRRVELGGGAFEGGARAFEPEPNAFGVGRRAGCRRRIGRNQVQRGAGAADVSGYGVKGGGDGGDRRRAGILMGRHGQLP